MLSSFPAMRTTCLHSVKRPDGTWNVATVIFRPTTVEIYNIGMVGTDSFDQRITYDMPKIKATSSWFPRTFIHIFVASV